MNCCRLDFKIEEHDVVFSIKDFNIEFSLDCIYKAVEGDYYEGEYTVIPKSFPQYLLTQGKTMRDDVTVEEIPYSETTNIYGGLTVNIGG